MATKAKRGRPVAQDTWGMAIVAFGLRLRRPDLTQEAAASVAISYVIAEVARQNNQDPRARPDYMGKVLQRLRDIENKRESFAKVVQRFHNPREGWTMVHGVREAIEGAMETLPPAN